MKESVKPNFIRLLLKGFETWEQKKKTIITIFIKIILYIETKNIKIPVNN